MLAAEPTHAQSQDLVVTDHGIDPATAGSGFVLQPANQVDDRDAVRATVEVVAQEGQPGLTPTPRTVRVEQFRLPERGDDSFAAPVHVADYIVHLPNLGTVRVIRCQTRGALWLIGAKPGTVRHRPISRCPRAGLHRVGQTRRNL